MTGKNRLSGETSPYLLQHRANPIHWWPWGQMALDTAKRENRPILLSVGYSACHWCHVMAHECFEDEEVASVMNDLFVNIKVDREERPDIDQIFMAALNATGEQGGWPLTMFLTPSGQPFWGGTYFPRTSKYGRPGFIQVMHSVQKAWTDRPGDIRSGASELTRHISGQLSPDNHPGEISEKPLLSLAGRISQMMDPVHGGISGAPKFPNAPYMMSLWLAAHESKNRPDLKKVLYGLEKMLCGGIYDHIGGGLCRYSTDAQWIIPHFEKMLYDNGQLIQLCTLAHAFTQKKMFRERIDETVNWLEREMTTISGAYASSLDADSEGEEGKFYVWTEPELDTVLGDDKEHFLGLYRLVSPKSWEGNPVIVRSHPGSSTPCSLLSRLLANRNTRIPPGRDDKVLTDWNGITVRAIADAARYFGQNNWTGIAERLFDAISRQEDQSGRLPHSVNGPSKLFPALSMDYAAMINAAVSLFELTGKSGYIESAKRWCEFLKVDHGDGEGGHFLTSSTASDVPIRIRGDIDEATPSATSQIIEALTRLATATGNPRRHEEAMDCASAAMGRTRFQSHGQAGIFNAVYMAVRSTRLVIVENPTKAAFSRVARSLPDVRRIDVTIPLNADNHGHPVPEAADFDTSKPAAWLCRGQTCLPPMTSPDRLKRQLSAELLIP